MGCVEQVVMQVKQYWPEFEFEVKRSDSNPHEAFALNLDSSLAHFKLGWRQVWQGARQTFIKTITWYQQYHEHGRILSETDLSDYIEEAQEAELPWAG